jgi:hypothetical protein
MQEFKIDFAKLLGFAQMDKELTESINFQDDTFGARLGAKVGGVETDSSEK